MSLSGLEKGLSVPFSRVTLYWSGVRICFHSASVLITFLIPLALAVPPLAFPAATPFPATAGFPVAHFAQETQREGCGFAAFRAVSLWLTGDGFFRRGCA